MESSRPKQKRPKRGDYKIKDANITRLTRYVANVRKQEEQLLEEDKQKRIRRQKEQIKKQRQAQQTEIQREFKRLSRQ